MHVLLIAYVNQPKLPFCSQSRPRMIFNSDAVIGRMANQKKGRRSVMVDLETTRPQKKEREGPVDFSLQPPTRHPPGERDKKQSSSFLRNKNYELNNKMENIGLISMKPILMSLDWNWTGVIQDPPAAPGTAPHTHLRGNSSSGHTTPTHTPCMNWTMGLRSRNSDPELSR